MRKDTKQKIMVAFIALIFLFSSVAFVANMGTEEQQNYVELTDFVVDGELSPATELEYLRNGYTIMKYYYNDTGMISYIDTLPEMFITASDEIQLIVEKIENETERAVITGPYGETELENVTEITVFEAMCNSLLFPPPECIVLKGPHNIPNETNYTG